MDRIDDCISKGMHITKNPKFHKDTWEDFEIACQGKKLIIYGITNQLIFLWQRCNNFRIDAVIDNDLDKQGAALKTFFDENDLKEAKEVKISPKAILKNYASDEVVVLISSLKFYEDIAAELDSMGIHNYFSILNLEYNYRNYMQKHVLPIETEEIHISNYAKKMSEYPIQQNKIVVYSARKGYADHGKYIIEQLLLMDTNLEIIWISPDIFIDLPVEIKAVNFENVKQVIREMETAKIWLSHDLLPSYLIKRKNQILVQLKHWGSITLKKFYLLNKATIKNQIHELNAEWTDYIITGSKFDEVTCQVGYDFKGKFIRCGSPRSDAMFLKDKLKKKVYDHFGLNFNDKTLLYAPTYRFDRTKLKPFEFVWQDLDFDMLLQSLKERWGGNWKILLRLHPIIRANSKQVKRPDFVIDVSNYSDSEELAAASDIMISDYSSVVFESAYVSKPVFLFAPDKSDYAKKDFGFLLDYNDLPFPTATTNEELSKQIVSFNEQEYKKAVMSFFDKYEVHEDGHASERAAKFIIDLLKGNLNE